MHACGLEFCCSGGPSGAYRRYRARRRHRRHVHRGPSRQARPVGRADRSRRAGGGHLLRQCRHHRGQHRLPGGVSVSFAELVRIALKRSPVANYHLAYLPRIAPWLVGLPRRVAAGAADRDCTADAAAVCPRGRRARGARRRGRGGALSQPSRLAQALPHRCRIRRAGAGIRTCGTLRHRQRPARSRRRARARAGAGGLCSATPCIGPARSA